MDLAIAIPWPGVRGPGWTGQRIGSGLPGPPADYDPGRGTRRGGPCWSTSASCWAAVWISRRPITWLGAGRSFATSRMPCSSFIPIALFMGLLLVAPGLRAFSCRHPATTRANEAGRGALLAGHHRPPTSWPALLAGIAGSSMSASSRPTRSPLAVPARAASVAAAVIGGTSIFGGRGGYSGPSSAPSSSRSSPRCSRARGAGGHPPRRLRAHHPGRHGAYTRITRSGEPPAMVTRRGHIGLDLAGPTSSGAGGAQRRSVAHPGPGQVAHGCLRGEKTVVPQLARLAIEVRDRAADPSPALCRPVPASTSRDGRGTFLTNVPGDWSATPVGARCRPRTDLAHGAHQRNGPAFGCRSCAFGAGRDVRNFVGLNPGHRHRRGLCHRRPGRAGYRGPGGRAGSPDHRSRRALVGCGNRGWRGGPTPGLTGGHRVRHRGSTRASRRRGR